jgi:uncharacterized RDD family membrane protein YckC
VHGFRQGNRIAFRYNPSAMDYVEFSTPEDVDLGYTLVGPSSRFGGYVLDRILLLLFQIMFVLIFVTVGYSAHSLGDSDLVLLAIYLVMLGFSEFLYFGICEWRSNGSSPGKKNVGSKVIMAGGHRLTPGAILVRNLFRPIDMIPLFWIVPLLDGQCRRLGDLVAGTLVVRVQSDKTDPNSLRAPLSHKKYSDLIERHINMVGSDQGRLGAAEFHAIEEYILRAGSFARPQRDHLAKAMIAPLLHKLQRPEYPHFRRGGAKANQLIEEIYLALRDNPRLMS